ncbi:4-hydroxyproline epimerase [Flavobacteriaceae bacterium]|jgi:4-hydroxyproline epimerase|nr:4-hydroxyproline epimerase [Flavobacteriaceae bacterium]MDA9184026.1 4-hydroxyproline epimerase [Flavobacteriaceae bacterium]MDB4117925.1 4-hydroxyproline epimerase [Flavobacteriaceae bacterium]MDB9886169.1 4-hydroxyproline epimerase [Flavobacteriaceae bacterium]MDC0013955.1 4-hydroxyproline epimerase [Flavobacteriaceae bacterium]
MNKAPIFDCIDAHTAGNPVRLVKGPRPNLVGKNMMEKRLHFLGEFDWIRKGLMFEPRGHDMMSGSFYFEPCEPQNDVAILFIETSGCLPMCGHGLIGTMTILLEEKLIQPKVEGKVRVETPAGLVEVNYKKDGDKVTAIRFKNIPSYLALTDGKIKHPVLGELSFDVGYGGNFYAIIDVQQNFNGLEHYTADELITYSRSVRKLVNKAYSIQHLEDKNIKGCSHVLWAGKTISKEATARNAVFYGDKAIDRSPCGTGTSARMAQWFAQGKLDVGDSFIHESIIGSIFNGRVEEETTVGGQKAIVPSIEGTARITGYNSIILDKNDPYVEGFQVL